MLFVLVSPFVLAFWTPCLGKRELTFVLLVHLFVCFARVCFCPFSLPFGVEGWLGLWLWHILDLSINLSVLILWENTEGAQLLLAILLAEVLVIGPTLCFPSLFEYALAFERAVPLAFRLCCFCFGAIFIVGVLSRLVLRAGCGIRFIGTWPLPQFYLLRVPHITFVLKTLYNRQTVLIVFLIFAKCQQTNK